MSSLTCPVTGPPGTAKRCRVSGCSAVRGSKSPPSPLSVAQPGALPTKCEVSSSTTSTDPAQASRTSTQSFAWSRRREVSQPSPITRAWPGSSRLAGEE